MDSYDHLKLLGALCGIDPKYVDIWGRHHLISDQTQKLLLEAMGIRLDSRRAVAQALSEFQGRYWLRWLEPVLVVQECDSSFSITISIPRPLDRAFFRWVLEEENGLHHQGEFYPFELKPVEEKNIEGTYYVRYSLQLPVKLGTGYHRFKLSRKKNNRCEEAVMSLVVAPSHCYMSSGLKGAERAWGPAVQLYALRSHRNWGIGDLTDLKNLVRWCAEVGAGVIGINPLHSTFSNNPSHASPYSPSSRCFLNIFYLDVESIPDFSESETAREMVLAPEFQVRLRSLRNMELVDYEGIAKIKLPVLEVLWQHFHEHHLKLKNERGREFKEFQSLGGISLERQALFEALQEHFQRKGPSAPGWMSWPKAYHNPASAAVSNFARAHSGHVEFFQYLQWQTDLQLEIANKQSSDCGLSVGIYRDLAVGIDKGGAGTWANQSLYALDANIGAPPDDFNLLGQDWGLPPMIPHRLRERAYRPFIDILRSNMKHAGALRVDHIMGLFRLYWVPVGASPTQGAYVRYPLHDLMGILALESQRNRCIVIGEDLGTVPDEVRLAMKKWGVLSYCLLYFERTGEKGNFISPKDYPSNALATITTHDLPTLRGFWGGRDVEIRTELDLFPNKEMRRQQIKGREIARICLIESLKNEGLLPEGLTVGSLLPQDMAQKFVLAVHQFLARTPCKLLTFQFEDIIGQIDQINMPGTTCQYPNWRRKLTVDLESLFKDSFCKDFFISLRKER